ncbi:MAG: hypothetical protein SCK57_05825 [Bacillota bacterium]|nr:hypothetical protein [Bacillota bacterium]MDW7677161.1 hypothetical protein [Bacillota bacterium]
MHKEYREKEFLNKGGVFHMIKLWVNLPKIDKFVPVHYQDLPNSKLGKMEFPEDAGNVTVVSGEFMGVKGDGRVTFEEPEDYNTGILITEDQAVINDTACAHLDFILFEKPGRNNKPGIR